MKKLLDSIKENAIYDLIKYSLLAVASSGISFSAIFKVLKTFSIPICIVIILSISLAALISFFVLTIYMKKSKKFLPQDKVECEYDILEKTVEFHYDGEKSYYNASIKLKFNQKCREYYGRFYWSGSGNGNIKAVNSNYSLKVLKQRTRNIEYIVVFDKAYRKGKTLTLNLVGEMNDPNGQFSPYFATTVSTPTNKLKIVLKIDPRKYPICGLEREAVAPQKFHHEDSEEVTLDENGTYIWEIETPKISYQYSLNWSFCGCKNT